MTVGVEITYPLLGREKLVEPDLASHFLEGHKDKKTSKFHQTTPLRCRYIIKTKKKIKKIKNKNLSMTGIEPMSNVTHNILGFDTNPLH